MVDGTKREIIISEDVVSEVENLKYLESFIQKEDDFDEDVEHRIMCG